MANMSFGVNLLPKTNASYSVGNSDYKWNAYLNSINGHSPDIVIVNVTATSNTSTTVSNAKITADHVVLNDYQPSDVNISYTTSAGAIALSCSSGIPAMTLYLGVAS